MLIQYFVAPVLIISIVYSIITSYKNRKLSVTLSDYKLQRHEDSYTVKKIESDLIRLERCLLIKEKEATKYRSKLVRISKNNKKLIAAISVLGKRASLYRQSFENLVKERESLTDQINKQYHTISQQKKLLKSKSEKSRFTVNTNKIPNNVKELRHA